MNDPSLTNERTRLFACGFHARGWPAASNAARFERGRVCVPSEETSAVNSPPRYVTPPTCRTARTRPLVPHVPASGCSEIAAEAGATVVTMSATTTEPKIDLRMRRLTVLTRRRSAQPSDRTNNALEFQLLPSISGPLIGVAVAPITPFVVSVVPLVKLTALRTPVLWPK